MIEHSIFPSQCGPLRSVTHNARFLVMTSFMMSPGGHAGGDFPFIEEFLRSLENPNARWGFFHMIVAQKALERPIHVARPVEGGSWLMQPINDFVGGFVHNPNLEVPEATEEEPLRLLPTGLNEVCAHLSSLSHWDPLLPLPPAKEL